MQSKISNITVISLTCRLRFGAATLVDEVYSSLAECLPFLISSCKYIENKTPDALEALEAILDVENAAPGFFNSLGHEAKI